MFFINKLRSVEGIKSRVALKPGILEKPGV